MSAAYPFAEKRFSVEGGVPNRCAAPGVTQDSSGNQRIMNLTHPTFWSIVFSGLALVFLPGCFHAVLLQPESLQDNTEEDIVVSTKDGRQISFDSYDYNIISDANGNLVLSGKGKAYRKGSSQFAPFEGDIPLNAIDRISTSEKTALFYPTILALAVAAWLVFWVAHHLGRLG